MTPNPLFQNLPPEFWAHVRTISQKIGYTERGTKKVLIPSIKQIEKAFRDLNLSYNHIEDHYGNLSLFGKNLTAYFTYRADILNDFVQHKLMNKDEAKALFLHTLDKYKPSSECPLPLNKQKGDKKDYAFLTCMINIILEAYSKPYTCNYDPRSLTTVTHQGKPLRTLSRRVDGAFPEIINPIAIWEIKEYYNTTTFGSRVADGVYETLLDGMELKELEQAGHYKINHIMMIDSHFTWWECGRSYLCRILDMLHMGFVDEVLFGKEVVERLPLLIENWKKELKNLQSSDI